MENVNFPGPAGRSFAISRLLDQRAFARPANTWGNHGDKPPVRVWWRNIVPSGKASHWSVYGKAMQELAKDPAFQKLLAEMNSFSELTARNITLSIDL